MFHRVKSETTPETEETTMVEEHAAPEQASLLAEDTPAETETTLEMEDTAEDTHAEATEEVAAAPAEAPAQNLYKRAAASISRPSAQYTAPTPAAPTYTAPKAPAASYTASSDAEPGDRRLTIGRGITMSGEIEYCDELYVEGTVEAALKGASDLHIAESGVFYGTVEIEEATIAGRFEGEIVVNGCLTVESTGVITGSISYKELAVKNGAVIDGRITPIMTQQAATAAPNAKQSAHVPAANHADKMVEAAE